MPDPAGTRGKGDYLDLVATDVLHDFFHDQGRQVASFIVSGRGDGGIDLVLWDRTTEKPIEINIKTSDPPRMRPGLNLIIKHEELARPKLPAVYIQCIMRAGRPDPTDPHGWLPSIENDQPIMDAHLYILGWARVHGPEWEKMEVRPIENTEDGHVGGHILDAHLRPIEELVELAADAI